MVLIILLLFVISLLVLTKLYCFIFGVYCKSNVCLVGKTALVTGGGSGIGFQIVLGLAARGCRVIIADKVIDSSIKDEILKETNNPNIVLKYVDLASFKSVRNLAEDLNSTENCLDILMNNAGILSSLSDSTEDDLDPVMQVNHYSSFLFTHLLIDLLKKSPCGRVVFTSSLISHVHTLSVNRIQDKKISVRKLFLYPDSKFCNLVTADIFAKKLKIYGITSNSWHPLMARSSLVRTGLTNTTDIFVKLLQLFFYVWLLATKSTKEAAQTGIYLACANEVQDVSGQFFGECFPLYKPKGSSNSELYNALWECSEKAVKLKTEEKL